MVNNINDIALSLASINAKLYNYQGTNFVAIENFVNGNHIVILEDQDFFVVEFCEHKKSFTLEDLVTVCEYVTKIYNDDLILVDFYKNESPVFGGMRDGNFDFSTAVSVASSFALGNEQKTSQIMDFIKKNLVSVISKSFSGKLDRNINLTIN